MFARVVRDETGDEVEGGGMMGTCFCVLSHFMVGRVRRRGCRSCFVKDGKALGVLSGTVAGSRQMGVSQAAGQWPRGGSKMQREDLCLRTCQIHCIGHPQITGGDFKECIRIPE